MNKREEYLRKIPRIQKEVEANEYEGDVFWLPSNIEFSILENDLVNTKGLGEKRDSRNLDLIRTINIKNALNVKFEFTNILTPLAYAESLHEKPLHITTQSVLFTKITEDGINWIKEENKKNIYGKHEFDAFWLPFSRPLQDIQENDILCIFNRRVNGWDGSPERPVIELLGAGGHLPVIWNEEKERYEPLSIKENLRKEFIEELNLDVDEDSIVVFGGFENPITYELVILCGVIIDDTLLPRMQEYAKKNIDVDTAGIYMGTFKDVIEFYRKNPVPFAGGEKSAPYNFPNREDLMKKVFEFVGQ